MKVSENFDIREFVSPETYQRNGDDSVKFIDPELIKLAEFIRSYFGASVTINNWHIGGNMKYRGFRDFDCNVGGQGSQHRLGKGFDCNVKGFTIEQLHKAIMKDEAAFFKAGLRRIEDIKDAPTWLHCDIKETGWKNKIFVFRA